MTEDQILQISNDISEDMLNPRVTKEQLVEVICFFRSQFDKKQEQYWSLITHLSLLVMENSMNASRQSRISVPPNQVALEGSKE